MKGRTVPCQDMLKMRVDVLRGGDSLTLWLESREIDSKDSQMAANAESERS